MLVVHVLGATAGPCAHTSFGGHCGTPSESVLSGWVLRSGEKQTSPEPRAQSSWLSGVASSPAEGADASTFWSSERLTSIRRGLARSDTGIVSVRTPLLYVALI